MRLPYEPRRLERLLLLGASLVAGFVLSASASADTYPTRPIDFIVPWGTGGGADYVGRALAKEMQPILGVSLPVLNVPGGTGQTGLIKMRDSKPDGYTVVEMTSETVLLEVTGKPLFKLSDFVCLGVVDQQYPGLLVRVDGPFKSWQDVAAAAKSKQVSVAFDGYGSSGDLIVNYLNRKLGTKFELVPYDKPGERIASVLGGHNDLLFTQPGDVLSYISGKQLYPDPDVRGRQEPGVSGCSDFEAVRPGGLLDPLSRRIRERGDAARDSEQTHRRGKQSRDVAWIQECPRKRSGIAQLHGPRRESNRFHSILAR